MKHLIYIIAGVLLFSSCKNEQYEERKRDLKREKEVLNIQYGFNLEAYHYTRDTVKSGDTFGSIMASYQVDAVTVHKIVEVAGDSINLVNLRRGNPYMVLQSKDKLKKVQRFIYETDKINYVVVDLTDSVAVHTKQKPVTIKRRVIASNIQSSLSQTINNEGVDYALAHQLSLIYAWTVDFFKIKEGDGFGVILNERYINDTIYGGIENVEATFFHYEGKTIYAFPFVQDSTKMQVEYFDEKANALKSMFLKAPLKFSRISSRFSPKRFHPVQKRWKAHKGTDYAAPTGTPIMTTASGTVINAGFSGGNGRYVKVKHNAMYATQYLHMSKIAVKKGQHVSQGQVIGYVGSSGLATGPHVCYRFWKNGIQVDPLIQKVFKSNPLNPKYKEQYLNYIQPLKKELDSIAKIKLSK